MSRRLFDQRFNRPRQSLARVAIHLDEANGDTVLVPIHRLGVHGDETFRQRDLQHEVNVGGLLAAEIHEAAAEIQVVDEDRCLWANVIPIERSMDAGETPALWILLVLRCHQSSPAVNLTAIGATSILP